MDLSIEIINNNPENDSEIYLKVMDKFPHPIFITFFNYAEYISVIRQNCLFVSRIIRRFINEDITKDNTT